MKKIYIVSIIPLLINLFVLVAVPIIFVLIFNLFPNLDGSENGLGAFPLLCVILGGYSLFFTIPFTIIVSIFNFLYHLIKSRRKNK
jgi:hypothetical protein